MLDFRFGLDRQSYEYWLVDKATWADSAKLACVRGCSHVSDTAKQTVSSANMELTEAFGGELAVRAYMVAVQAGERSRLPLGTWLATRDGKSFDGVSPTCSAVLYSPLMALANRDRTGNRPPVGYTVPAGVNCAAYAAAMLSSHGIAPVTASESPATLDKPYVAGYEASWLDVAEAILEPASFEVGLDDYGRVTVGPSPGPASVPVGVLRDEEPSMICPDISETVDWLDVPSAVEVVWDRDGTLVTGRATIDPASPFSAAERGYENVLRLVNPEGLQSGCDERTATLLAEARMAEEEVRTRTLKVRHVYNGMRAGDVIEVDHRAAGIQGVGRIVRQEARHGVGMTVTSTVEVRERPGE